MTSADSARLIFTAFNLVRLIGYVPQITRLAKDETGAQAVSIATWLVFALSHISTVVYALIGIDDLAMAGVFSANAVCCMAIVLFTWRARRNVDGVRARPFVASVYPNR